MHVYSEYQLVHDFDLKQHFVLHNVENEVAADSSTSQTHEITLSLLSYTVYIRYIFPCIPVQCFNKP